ncbi:hypothetical protein GTP41_05030 [Pseudoduganella sp. DS3]|uniref:Uncharacterized protein n=1 Tax=Pseudoduganella guangdongensis TaxID=2692179 RepID=A0A6N9HD37_9BURK|nr:hypothetical protein [Pseudoduganella guangdongensis]MYN01458.1 hypothetical protein [Pseudoduganella guangdongensis]
MQSLECIQQNSLAINHLLARINALASERHASPGQRAAWQAACEDFYTRYDRLCFPGGAAMLERVRGGDPAAIDAAVQFLLADPYHFRSGYLKERLWRWLARLPLAAGARARLERAALAYLDRRICREFWAMCKAMPRIAGAGFWRAAAAQALPAAADARDPVARRATLLLAHGASVHAGALARQRFYQSC